MRFDNLTRDQAVDLMAANTPLSLAHIYKYLYYATLEYEGAYFGGYGYVRITDNDTYSIYFYEGREAQTITNTQEA